MFPISSSLLDTEREVKNDEPGEPIRWQLHSSSIEMSVEDINSVEIGNQELADLELSPISPATGSNHQMNVCSFSDMNVADKNVASSTKSDSPGVESGKDYSSISSFSTLTSASKLPTEDIDFINFYFENNRRQTQLKENSVSEVPVPIATRNRFLDCSPIPKLNFDETLINLPSPGTGCSHIRTSPASAESVLEEELYVVQKNIRGYMDESVACAGSFSRPPACLSAPVNSPNATAEMGSIPSSSKLWYGPPAKVDGLPAERPLGQGVTNILPASAAQEKWKLDLRPPCVGQEYSPESELNFPDTWRAIRNAADQRLSPSTTDTVDSDIDLTEINPPSPVLKNSARKVGSWLQHLQEGEYSEDQAVESGLAVKASTLNMIECVRSSEKCKCGAYNDYMNARKKLVGGFHDASITTAPSTSAIPIGSAASHCKTLSAVARKQWTSDSSHIAVVPPIDSYQHRDEKVKRHYRKSRRSDGVKRHGLYNLVNEKELQNVESDGSCTRRTSRTHEPTASSSSGAKHGHHAQNSECRESNLSSDDNTLCSRVEDARMHKTLTKNPSSTVFFVGHTLNPPWPVLKKSQTSSKRVLAKKLKAISLYMRHKKTHSHLNFKTLAIV